MYLGTPPPEGYANAQAEQDREAKTRAGRWDPKVGNLRTCLLEDGNCRCFHVEGSLLLTLVIEIMSGSSIKSLQFAVSHQGVA